MTNAHPSNPMAKTDQVSEPIPDGQPPAQPLVSRRRAVLAGAAVAAIAGGAGLSLWMGKGGTAAVQEPIAGFWQLKWEAPGGTEVAMESFRGKSLLVNFWATWCPPCVEELPLINAYFNQHKANGRQVIGIAVDKRSAVEPFLQKQPLDFPIAIAGLGGAELSRTMGNLSGALPFSLLIGASGEVLHRKLGRLQESDLQAWAQLK